MRAPRRIAVVGAGPIGLEAALYGRFLGYAVDVYERGNVAQYLLDWGHVKMFTPWQENVSALGCTALAAQEPPWRPPEPGSFVTGREMVQCYFLPLAHSDLLVDSIHEHVEVAAIGRSRMLKGDRGSRRREPFRLLVRDRGTERAAEADVVIDATGTYGQHRWMGAGGIPAIGEMGCRSQIEYQLPDVAGNDRARLAGRRVAVVGAGHCAATTIVALDEVAAAVPGTTITWITRRVEPGAENSPVRRVENDPYPHRDRLALAANRLAAAGRVDHRPGTYVAAVSHGAAAGTLTLALSGSHQGNVEVDAVLAQVGHRPDVRLYEELRVKCGPVGEEALPRRAVGRFAKAPNAAELAAVTQLEPDFFVIGAKLCGRGSRFLLRHGRDQVRAVFAILGGRPDLDLDARMQ
jgi:thioredoxin reductase